MPEQTPQRLLILGAHPDDAEFHAGGLAANYRDAGHEVRMISVTDGAAGHHERTPEELRVMRMAEAAAAGKLIGAAYETWDFPDGHLMPTLELRHRIIAEIRRFRPDLVLTHRTSDYHPDHRAVGQAVQDASFLVTVPLVVPEVPALRRDPVVAYMCDLFTRPARFRADVVLDTTSRVDLIVRMLACHRSQVFEWLPYNQQVEDQLPAAEDARLVWLRDWFTRIVVLRAERFRRELVAAYGAQRGDLIQCCEAYEISEYAAPLDAAAREQLFPQSG